MKTRTRIGAVAAALLTIGAIGAIAPANAATDWPYLTAASYNLGGTVDGIYTDATGASFDGEGMVVVDIDGAFTAGNPAFERADGKSKIAGEACIGQQVGTTPYPSLCDTTTTVKSSAPGNDAMYFSMLAGSSVPSNSPVNECSVDGEFCHNYHGTATAGAIVGQPGTRGQDGETLYTAGAAVGAQVFQVKIGGGDAVNQGWPGESVVDSLYWVNTVLSESSQYKGRIAAINLSVSGNPLPEGALCGTVGQQIDAAAALLKAKGIAVVMAAGNESAPNSGTWNCGENIIRVGATELSSPHTLTSYTNRGETIRLHAPVGDGNIADQNVLLLPWKSAGTFYVYGTSFASPQVAGAYAVLREKFGIAPSVDELTEILQRTGTPVRGDGAAAEAVDINIAAALDDQP